MADYSAYDQSEGESNWNVKLEGFKDAVETDVTAAESAIAGKAPIATQAEVVAARGSAGSLDARIDVHSYEDGSLKSSTSPATWVDIPESFVRVDDNTFTITGVDYTALLEFGRALKLTVSGGTVYTRVKSSTFSTNTTVNVLEDVITAGPTACDYSSVKPESTSFVWSDVESEQGISSIAYTSGLPVTIIYDTGHKITITYNVDNLPDVVKYYKQDGATFDHKFTYAYDGDKLCTSITKSDTE